MSRAVSIVLAGLALTLVALMFDTAPLFVPGLAFTLLGLAAPAFVWLGSRHARVTRALDQRRVLEDEPLEASIVVERAWFGLGSGEVLEPLAPAPVPLPRRGTHDVVRVVLRFGRRGRLMLDPPSLIVRDPLDLASREVRGTGPRSELLVLPRTSAVELLEEPGGTEGPVGAVLRSELPAAVEIDGLRPYRTGTPASRIHWPAVARGRGLLERRLRAEADTRPLIVLDARSAEEGHLDAAVRAAASLVLELARTGGCGLLLPGDRRPTSIDSSLAAWPALHARLALVTDTSSPPVMTAARIRLGAVFYVAAQPLDRLPPAADGIARGAAALVLPATLDGPAGANGRPVGARFAVAGCLGYVMRARASGRRRARPTAAAAGGSAA